MRSLFCHGLVVFIFTASVLIPQKAFSSPLFDEGSWRAHSFYTRTSWAGLSSGIGGLQSDIKDKKAKKLRLEPSAISYSGGYLRANIENKQEKVKVSPKIVREAIKVIAGTDKLVFQVSVDQTEIRRNEYIDEALQGTEIGKRFLQGDLGFASIVYGNVALPKPRPTHPYNEALILLNTDAKYSELPTKWNSFPESYPQIYLYFDPNAPGLVRTEFKPQVFFRSPSGLPLEVDEEVQKLGERPYLPLIKDVKERPLAYRAISPELEQAASITATLGLLEAACRKPGSCKHLYSQTSWIKNFLTWNNGEPLENKTDEQQQGEIDTWWQEIQEKWKRLNSPVFQPGNTGPAWVGAYNVVQGVIQKKLLIETDEEKKQAEKLKSLATEQFLNYKNQIVPDDPLLLAAKAVVLAWNGKKAAAEQSLDQAIQLSAENHIDRIEVLKIAQYVHKYENPLLYKIVYSLIENPIESQLKEARTAFYNQVDKYLQSCTEDLANSTPKCSEKDLREWEAKANRAGLTQDTSYTSTRDIAWLHGRFAYLIGVQLKEKARKSDRLRFLSFYAQESQGEHRSQLRKWEADFKKQLEIISYSSNSTDWGFWITVISIFATSAFFYVITQRIKKMSIDNKRHKLEKILKIK
ncbi:MAG: hypothetical protein KME55_36015 [Nostoc indistinguendum CM1-VF10]|jgi:hypothetical protein|nr:hypothetical protein [Nostoc indistinguendum CM1-VF10]